MKKMRIILIILAASIVSFGFLVVQFFLPTPRVSSSAPTERFPILARFELPRDYGYFIGDEIPLTLVIETTGGVVLDLINLPQKGEKHGLFEIRNRTITSFAVSPEQKIYRAVYTLQYFGPTPLTTHFDALEILYAFPKDKEAPMRTYTYQSLFTQPVPISIARIGPMQSPQPLESKGPVDDPRSGIIWTAFTLGTVCLLVSFVGWGCEWWKRWQQRNTPRVRSLTAADRALHALQHEEALFFRPAMEPSLSVGARMDQILREYLHGEFGIPAFTWTTAELTAYLNGTPLSQELLFILEQCDTLKYAPPSASLAEERELWWEAMTLFQKLQEGASP
jgi:hypothetical protein